MSGYRAYRSRRHRQTFGATLALAICITLGLVLFGVVVHYVAWVIEKI